MTKSTAPLSALVVGCGRGGAGGGGAHSIGYAHGAAYARHPRTRLVAACDLDAGNLRDFAARFATPHASADLDALLAEARPEVVSICTYAGSHRGLVEKCLAAGVRRIWCEKPFALTLDDARAMTDAAAAAGACLVVNHYRRHLPLFRRAKELLDHGAIGPLRAMTATMNGWDQMEWGVHWLDLMRHLADDRPVAWVMGQVRCSGARRAYGHLLEEHSVNHFAFAHGPRGTLDGGVALPGGSAFRIDGDSGFIDLRADHRVILVNAEGRREIPVASTLHGAPHDRPDACDPWGEVLSSLLDWADGGPAPLLAAPNALLSTELALACYESALRRDRIDLPLGPQGVFPLERLAAPLNQPASDSPSSPPAIPA